MITPEGLSGDPAFQYWADGGVCGIFHRGLWPGVWMGHFGVKVCAWGKTVEPAKRILRDFWESEHPDLIIGWTSSENRAGLAFTRRLGFRVHGEMRMPAGKVIEQNWRPEWA